MNALLVFIITIIIIFNIWQCFLKRRRSCDAIFTTAEGGGYVAALMVNYLLVDNLILLLPRILYHSVGALLRKDTGMPAPPI